MKVSKSLLLLALAGVTASAMSADMQKAPETAMFVKKAAQGGMTEVEASRAALSKSQDPAIRSFAEVMVKDHTKANAELAIIAKSKGIDVPKKLDAEHQAAVTSLGGKSGSDFDREYSQHMKMDHDKTIELFEAASKSSDPEVAGFATKTLPTLKQHKQLAAKLPAM